LYILILSNDLQNVFSENVEIVYDIAVISVLISLLFAQGSIGKSYLPWFCLTTLQGICFLLNMPN
jgi:hypothetical protein